MNASPALAVEDLTLECGTAEGPVRAVDGATFSLRPGQALGLVGESGCGKTSIASCLMRLLPENGHIRSGRIFLAGEDVLDLPEAQMRHRRGKNIAMVFQAAMNSLNPVHRVGEQIIEAMEQHLDLTRDQMTTRLTELYERVGLDPSVMWDYPHEYSGGMKQRVVIAMALSCDPIVLVADEPTATLDVIVQDQILSQLTRIRETRSTAMIFISRDLGVIARVCDFLAVMYAGRLVEFGPTAKVLGGPIHRYTQALVAAMPTLPGPKGELAIIAGEPPDLLAPPAGCRFHPRCRFADANCRAQDPPLVESDDHWAVCFNPSRPGSP